MDSLSARQLAEDAAKLISPPALRQHSLDVAAGLQNLRGRPRAPLPDAALHALDTATPHHGGHPRKGKSRGTAKEQSHGREH